MNDLLSIARRAGVNRTLATAVSAGRGVIGSMARGADDRRFIFLSTSIDASGAPAVLVQIVKEFVDAFGPHRVRLFSWRVADVFADELRRLGVWVEPSGASMPRRAIAAQLGLRPDDFVLMNSIAADVPYVDYVLDSLRRGRLRRATWFVHEDMQQIAALGRGFQPNAIRDIREAADAGRLDLAFGSARTAGEYAELLGTDRVRVVRYRIGVPPEYAVERSPSDFAALRFLLSGTAGDGRKGQFLAIGAFYRFVEEFQRRAPELYRPFELRFIGVGDQGIVPSQIRWAATSLLGDAVTLYPPVPRAEAMTLSAECNVNVCCSLNELFPLAVAEGMMMGHVLLRNDAGGAEEQLVDGVNGLAIDHTDLVQFSEQIERLLNKEKTSDAQLAAMSRASQSMIRPYTETSYLSQLLGA